MSINKVTIIGSGAIGCSWAALFLANGLQVTAFDINPQAENLLRSLVSEALPTLERMGQLKNKDAKASDVVFTTNLKEALKNTDFVQENGPERLDFKRNLFNDIIPNIRRDTIIATSSSGLTCSSIQEGVKSHPERCVVGHPFNPPHMIPLVEVVGGDKTSEETISRTMAFYEGMGKKAVYVKKEVVGHIANRLQAAVVRECLHLLSEDVCNMSDIDTAMSYGPGLRWGIMGPGSLLHLGGGPGGIQHLADHLLGPLTTWWAPKDPVVDDELKKKFVEGTLSEINGRKYDAMAKQRDEELVALLNVRREWDNYAEKQKSHFFSEPCCSCSNLNRRHGVQRVSSASLHLAHFHSQLVHDFSSTMLHERRLYILDTDLTHWTSRRGRIISTRIDGSDPRVVVDNIKGLPDGIVVDRERNHMYVTMMGVSGFKANDGSIIRYNLDGSDPTTIVPLGATFTPKQVTIARQSKKLYWSDREGLRVMRCNLDGSDIEVLVQTGNTEEDRKDLSRWCVGIAVDEENGYFYWTQKGPSKGKVGRIFRARIDGPKQEYPNSRKERELLFEGLPEPIDLELDVKSQLLYWTDRGDPPTGNSLNRAYVGKTPATSGGRSSVGEVLAVRLHETIGLALDIQHEVAYVTDLAGGVYKIGTGKENTKEVLFAELGDITGIALV
ncbi:hypothetical protein IWZ03DRAFT_317491 [Phyllosticta citriasiana]|uniref:3-hydroxyacyl-CoA dehydrogenase n=1 Tax=Phyllosticta citriasiana TaxID=595635 RepID=A0ABR1KAT4_9PEZI